MNEVEGGALAIAYKAVYAGLSGGAATGLFLSQIAYWCLPKKGKSKLRINRNGKAWLAKTAKEMQIETGMTEHQYRKGVAKLKELGLIETKVFKFNGRPATHIWLNADRLAQLVELEHWKALQPKVAKVKSTKASSQNTKSICIPSPNPLGDIHQIHSVTLTNLYTEITTETTTETTVTPMAWVEKAKASDTDWVIAQPEKVAKENPTLHFPTEWWHMKAADVLARRQEGSLSHSDLQKGANGCTVLWKRLMATEYGGFQKAFVAADTAKLKQLCVACQEKTPDLIRLVVQDWGGFAWNVKGVKGLSAAPEQPNIGFLLKYHDVGMNMLEKNLQSIAKAHTQLPKVQVAPVVQPEQPQEPEQKPAIGIKAQLALKKEQEAKKMAELAKGPNAPITYEEAMAMQDVG